jgi:hypothetical protein
MAGAIDSIDSPIRATAADEARLQAEDDGRRLSLVIRKGRIVSAVHDGVSDPAEARVFDAFCEILAGLPIQEAADHAGHHVMARLDGPDRAPPVPGIVTPWNADPLYRRPMRLIRRIRDQHAARRDSHSTGNFWNPTIAKDWLRLDEAAQLARVDEILGEFLADRGLPPDGLAAVGVEGNVRVFLSFAETVGYERKPALLMDFERRLRARTGDRLEVFAEEMADGNRIRRL